MIHDIVTAFLVTFAAVTASEILTRIKPVEAHDRQILIKRRAFIKAVFICSCTIPDLHL